MRKASQDWGRSAPADATATLRIESRSCELGLDHFPMQGRASGPFIVLEALSGPSPKAGQPDGVASTDTSRLRR
jgi:hypothetical protein